MGPAVSVMAMSVDSHIVNHGSSPGPGGLKLMPGTCAYVPKVPRGMFPEFHQMCLLEGPWKIPHFPLPAVRVKEGTSCKILLLLKGTGDVCSECFPTSSGPLSEHVPTQWDSSHTCGFQ